MSGFSVASRNELCARCANLALAGVSRSYPYHLTVVVQEAGRLESPAQVHPVFFGCFDWHSAVHSHWLLVRTCRFLGDRDPGPRCHELLEEQFDEEALQREAEYLHAHPAFERPYGLAWVLALSHELALMGTESSARWQTRLEPLVAVATANLTGWLEKLGRPMRTGTHNQTAFALGLVNDWACAMGRPGTASLVSERAVAFFGDDRDYPLHLEPGGEDFLSASLGAASLMARLMEPTFFAGWLDRVLPELGRAQTLLPVEPADRSDGRLTHLDGLNLSRAWMLHDIAGTLPANDSRIASLIECADAHQGPGIASLELGGYEGAHWLGSFAGYLLGRMPYSV
ncbi:MAG: hypothetical protein CBC35_02310 [Planctomycetes bacterium TMED75]|nr:hypothetical protein [Planctomycetaceae bacterium]OUU95884.1 MAG: hypothetical protein CBC35_02310 [Planctomycetes bacterium TMED75]